MSTRLPGIARKGEISPAGASQSRFLRASSATNFAGGGYLAFAVVVGLADILHILRHYTRYPFGDYWIWLAVLYEKGPLVALYSQYNEHRLTVPGLLYLLDHRYFGGTNSFLILASVLIQTGCIALLVLPLWKQSGILKPVRYVFAGFVSITMLWFIQGENFYYAFSLCLACANLGILGAIHLFAQLHDRKAPKLHSAWVWAGMIGCAFWGTFSYGHGLLIWPTLLVIGVASRLPRRSLLVVAVAFACAAGLYFFEYKTPLGHASPFESLRHPLRVIHYMVIMIGLPLFGAGAQDVSLAGRFGSYVITTAGILASLAMLIHFAVMKAVDRIQGQQIYCSVIVLALGSAFITGLGRSSFPLEQALSGRYAPVPLLFWISVAGLATMYISRWEAQGGLGRAIWCAMLMAASTATLSTQFQMGRYLAIRERGQAAAALSITAGVPDTPRVAEELAALPLVSAVDQQAASSLGHSLFARPEAALLGSPLLTHFQLATAGACSGVVDLTETFPKPAAAGMRLFGWAWNERGRREATRMWVVDSQMIVRGLGITGVLRPDVAAARGNSAMETAGWIAYAKLPAPSGELTVFADLGDGKSVCQIGGPRKPSQ